MVRDYDGVQIQNYSGPLPGSNSNEAEVMPMLVACRKVKQLEAEGDNLKKDCLYAIQQVSSMSCSVIGSIAGRRNPSFRE